MKAGDNWPLTIVSEWTVLWAVTGLLPHSEALVATQPHAPILPAHMLPANFKEPEVRIFTWHLPIFKCWQSLHIFFLFIYCASQLYNTAKQNRAEALSDCRLPVYLHGFILLRSCTILNLISCFFFFSIDNKAQQDC